MTILRPGTREASSRRPRLDIVFPGFFVAILVGPATLMPALLVWPRGRSPAPSSSPPCAQQTSSALAVTSRDKAAAAATTELRGLALDEFCDALGRITGRFGESRRHSADEATAISSGAAVDDFATVGEVGLNDPRVRLAKKAGQLR